jgi:hypothetical protein
MISHETLGGGGVFTGVHVYTGVQKTTSSVKYDHDKFLVSMLKQQITPKDGGIRSLHEVRENRRKYGSQGHDGFKN